MKEKFLVTDIVPGGFLEGFADLGFDVEHYQELYHEDFLKMVGRFDGIVVNSHIKLDKETIDKAEKLKYILRPGSGLDNVDVAYAESKDIIVLNSPEGNKDAVGEHAIGVLLSLMNYIPRASEAVKEFKWLRQENKGTEIKGKTIGIIGYGNTGSAFARKLQGFEAELLVYDKYKPRITDPYVRQCTLNDIRDRADVISIHLPLTAETRYLINRNFIDEVQHPFYLLNTSRGQIVHTASLIYGLENAKVLGAGLDVLENERLATYTDEEHAQLKRLMNSGNVIITPHIAGWTKEAREKIFLIVLDKFRQFLGRKAGVQEGSTNK